MNSYRILTWLRSWRVREPITALILATYSFIAFMPAGYMPANEGAGLLKFCTSSGLVTQTPGEEGGAGNHVTDSSCPFALLPESASPPATPAATPMAAVVLELRQYPLTLNSGGTGPVRVQSARAPPANS